jgi:hypothetical protein
VHGSTCLLLPLLQNGTRLSEVGRQSSLRGLRVRSIPEHIVLKILQHMAPGSIDAFLHQISIELAFFSTNSSENLYWTMYRTYPQSKPCKIESYTGQRIRSVLVFECLSGTLRLQKDASIVASTCAPQLLVIASISSNLPLTLLSRSRISLYRCPPLSRSDTLRFCVLINPSSWTKASASLAKAAS